MIVHVARRIEHVAEYYFSQKLRQIQQMNELGEPVLNLGIGSPDLPPEEGVLKELSREVLESDHHAYQSYIGLPELRRAFAKWYSDYFEVSLDADCEVLPLMGSKEGLMHIAMSFLEEGDEVLVPNPAYPAYAAVSHLAGARVRYYDLSEEKSWLPELEVLEREDLQGVKIMWLNYPHMPTGASASKALFAELVAFAERHKMLLVNDNPYAFILNRPLSILSVPGAKRVALELNSLSKSHNMAGWRIGMLAGAAPYLQAVLRFKSNMDSGMFKPLQLAAAKALSLGRAWYAQQNEVYAARREKAFELLDLLRCSYDGSAGGLFVWAKIPERFAFAEVFSDLLLEKARVFITPGMVFGSRGQRYLRMSLCNEESVFEEAASRVRRSGIPAVL